MAWSALKYCNFYQRFHILWFEYSIMGLALVNIHYSLVLCFCIVSALCNYNFGSVVTRDNFYQHADNELSFHLCILLQLRWYFMALFFGCHFDFSQLRTSAFFSFTISYVRVISHLCFVFVCCMLPAAR
jgi:hypothetical protein